ncbi:hypothetical protein M2137_002283 [Parabacteroides sp. PFB2-10]|nr:hypothetical protein [Parabacteroides sp. PFB2-10]
MFLPGVCLQSPEISEKNSRDFDKMTKLTSRRSFPIFFIVGEEKIKENTIFVLSILIENKN